MIETNFKHTEIGLIPHDWEVKNIKDCFDFKQGVQCAVNLQSLQQTDGKIRFIRIIDLTQPNELPRYITDPGNSHHVKKQDLFMVRYGSPGLVGYGYEGVIANNLFRLLPKTEICTKLYKYILTDLHEEIVALSSSSTMPAVNFTALSMLQLPIPPTLAEQERIAGALSSIDTLIGALNEQIEKKRHIKQGTMQQLLTGKKRLAGFTGEWKEVRLGELGYVIRGVGFKPEQVSVIYKKGYICLLRSNNVDKACINYDNVIFVDSVCVNDKQIMRREDILLCAANGSRNLVGKAGRKIDDKLNTFGAFMCVFRCEDIKSAPFVSFLLQSSSYLKQLDEILAGSAINNLNAKQFGNMSFSIPSTIAEQSAIAAVLSGMDTEIAALEQKRDKYIAIKSGMMQDLLTGKIRLV